MSHPIHQKPLRAELVITSAKRIGNIFTGSTGSEQKRIRIGGLKDDKCVALIAAKELNKEPSGCIKNFITRLFWKRITITTSKGQEQILVNINSAVKRLQALGFDRKDIKEALNNDTLADLLNQQKTKQILDAVENTGMILSAQATTELQSVVGQIQQDRNTWLELGQPPQSVEKSEISYTFNRRTNGLVLTFKDRGDEVRIDYDTGQCTGTNILELGTHELGKLNALKDNLGKRPGLVQLNSEEIAHLFRTIKRDYLSKIERADREGYLIETYQTRPGQKMNILYEPDGFVYLHFQIHDNNFRDDVFYDLKTNSFVQDPLQTFDISIDKAHKIHKFIKEYRPEFGDAAFKSVMHEGVDIIFTKEDNPQVRMGGTCRRVDGRFIPERTQ